MATATNPGRPTASGDNQENNTLNTLFSQALTINWEMVAYIVILSLAIFTRFYALGDRVMSHDESLHTRYSFDLYDSGFFEHTPLMHGPILFHFTALSYWLFGVNDYSARIYTAVLGVAIVMFPLLFRRWLGRTGAVLASLMLLASPLMLYYSRYIRHDMPSILSALIMFYAIMMYLSGPENQRRRAHWLYLLSIGMIWNLGSKETAFIYIAIFGLFLTIYWVMRMLQHFFDLPGRIIMDTFVLSGVLAGVASLGMIVVISIALADMSLGERLSYIGGQLGGLFSPDTESLRFVTALSWTGGVIVSMMAVIVAPALWVYRQGKLTFTLMDGIMGLIGLGIFIVVTSLFTTTHVDIVDEREVIANTSAAALAVGFIVSASVLLIYAAARVDLVRTSSMRRVFGAMLVLMFSILVILIAIEELSHVSEEDSATEIVQQPVPGEEGAVTEEVSTTDFTILPLILAWVIAGIVIGGLFFAKFVGLWDLLDAFPEFDVLIVMGSLILPWLTAVFIVSTRGSPEDYTSIGESAAWLNNLLPVSSANLVGQFVVGFIAWVPMMAISITAGLLWNWRRWLICAAIFHAIFAFFFTTIFTNIQGLATGMIYSLQYWLEQQEVRRGSQPQYYYLLIIMPLYELLPIIGSVLAMIAGMVMFWRRQRAYDEVIDPASSKGMLGDEIESSEGEDINHDEMLPTPHTTLDHDPELDAMVTHARESVENEETSGQFWRLNQAPFLLFVAFWAVVNLFGYTLAGEKMPWLGTHLTVPMILLSGWYFGRIVEKIQWNRFTNYGWLYLILLPFLFVGMFQIFAPYLGGRPPFTGTQQTQLEWTYGWIAAVVITGVIVYAVYRLMAFTGWSHLRRMIALVSFSLLLAMTFRAAWVASFINYDEATEFLVYAHAAPANKHVTEQLADLSFRITDGMDMKVMHDNRFSWPGSWYMRDFNNSIYIGENAPTLQQLDDTVAVIVGDSNRAKVEPLLEDSFQRFDHIRMWWPIQDYFGLNAESMSNFFNFSEERYGNLRRGIFDIWWERDYSTYGDYRGREITLTNWPVSDRMHVYIRKDYAAQIWPYGVGDATVLNPFTEVEVNQCAANWQQLSGLVFDTTLNPLNIPVGLDADSQGRVFVAEDSGREISVFDQNGAFIESFGQPGTRQQEGAFFERPHSVAVDPLGNIFVVDTWNFRIRKFTPSYGYITGWGQEVTDGFEASVSPTDGMWGPRDIAIDDNGLVYISDTGNKRVRVYTSEGEFVRDIGSGGTGDGQLNEPSGLAINNGLLYVADTWNRRVAVFTLDGAFVQNFEVRGWREELGNRPYIAVDGERNMIYVTDPDAGRVLVHDINGECLGSFGQLNRENPNNSEFGTVGGVTVDDAGNVYVTDLANGRLLRFAPFERPIVIPEVDTSSNQQPLQPPIIGGEQGGPQIPGLPVDPETTGEVQAPIIPPFANDGEDGAFIPPIFAQEATPEIGDVEVTEQVEVGE